MADLVTTEQQDEVLIQLEALRRELDELRQRIDRWAANGLGQLDRGSAFAGSGGLYGTKAMFKRSDGT